MGLLEDVGRGPRWHGAQVHHVYPTPLAAAAISSSSRATTTTDGAGGEQQGQDEADQRQQPHDCSYNFYLYCTGRSVQALLSLSLPPSLSLWPRNDRTMYGCIYKRARATSSRPYVPVTGGNKSSINIREGDKREEGRKAGYRYISL